MRQGDSAAVSPNGQLPAAVATENLDRVFEGGTGKQVARFAHHSQVNPVAFIPDGLLLATVSADNGMRVFEICQRQRT